MSGEEIRSEDDIGANREGKFDEDFSERGVRWIPPSSHGASPQDDDDSISSASGLDLEPVVS